MDLVWLADINGAFGEPDLHSGPREIRTDEGTANRQSWTWLAKGRPAQHHIQIEEFKQWDDNKGKDFIDWTSHRYWVIRMSSSMTDMDIIEYRTRTEPDSVLMYKLMNLIGFMARGWSPHGHR